MTENHWLEQTLPNPAKSVFVEFDEYMEKYIECSTLSTGLISPMELPHLDGSSCSSFPLGNFLALRQ